jgi:hypothetical protein
MILRLQDPLWLRLILSPRWVGHLHTLISYMQHAQARECTVCMALGMPRSALSMQLRGLDTIRKHLIDSSTSHLDVYLEPSAFDLHEKSIAIAALLMVLLYVCDTFRVQGEGPGRRATTTVQTKNSHLGPW